MKFSSIIFIIVLSTQVFCQSITITPTNQGEMIKLEASDPYQNLDLPSNRTGGVQFRNSSNQSVLGGLWYKGVDKVLNLSSNQGGYGLTYHVDDHRVGIGTRTPSGKLTVVANNFYNPHLTLEGSETEQRFSNAAGTQYWQIKTRNNFGSSDFFEIRKKNSITSLYINGNNDVGIGKGGILLKEKLHVGGNIRASDTEPFIRLHSESTVNRSALQFMSQSENVVGELKYSVNKMQWTNGNSTGIIVNNDVGINTEPDPNAELTVQGSQTNITEATTFQVKSGGSDKLMFDGRTINSKNKLSLNNITNSWVEIGSDNFLDSETHQTRINGYTRLGLNAPFIKTKEISQTLSSTANTNSISTSISDFSRILNVSCLVHNDDDEEAYLPGSTIPNYGYEVTVRNNSILISNIGSQIKGKKAVLFITYKQ